MATKLDQKAYLQKYLSGGTEKKKKKRKIKGKGFKIIDDDIDISKLRPLDGDELDILAQGEDAPQIAGIIDERPEEVQKMEEFKITSKWRVVTQDDGFNSKIEVEEIHSNIKDKQKENEIIFGKMYSDSEDENDTNQTSSTKNTNNNKQKQDFDNKQHENYDSDASPPRKNYTNMQNNNKNIKQDINRHKNYDSDESPPRKSNTEIRITKTDTKRHEKYDSDASPRRKSITDSRTIKKDAKNHKNYNRSSESPPRKSNTDTRKTEKNTKRYKYDDESSPRKSYKDTNKYTKSNIKQKYDSDESPPRKKEHRIDKNKDFQTKISSNLSSQKPERKRKPSRWNNDENTNDKDSDQSPSRNRRTKYDSDQSPPRNRKRESDSDQSPPRKDSRLRMKSRRNSSDSDPSPPRKQSNYSRIDDSPPPTNKKMAKTLEGKRSGLQDARQLVAENEAFRQREKEVFNKMTDDVSGRNAKVASRKGKRDTSQDRQKQREKAERQKELDEKYKKWNKGIKQVEAEEQRFQDYRHEASKPMARFKDDKDLETALKKDERAGDPMLAYIRDRKRERGELGPERPLYKGNFPPNRFNIRPGFRWDGVDRSIGYENKFFEHKSKRKAMEEEAYKWSTADL